MKLNKENCVQGTKCVVTDKLSQWNRDTGAINNGMMCFMFKPEGVLIGDELELLPGSIITIQSKPKRFNGNGNQVKFTIEGSDVMFAAWWICIKSKVKVINEQ